MLLPGSRCKSPTDHLLDINSELDELDREEFYRLKKVLKIFVIEWQMLNSIIGCQQKAKGYCCTGR